MKVFTGIVVIEVSLLLLFIATFIGSLAASIYHHKKFKAEGHLYHFKPHGKCGRS